MDDDPQWLWNIKTVGKGIARVAAAVVFAAVGSTIVLFVGAWTSRLYIFDSMHEHGHRLSFFGTDWLWRDYGLIRIENGDAYVTIILEKDEWGRLREMWHNVHYFEGPSRQPAGSIAETDADDARLYLFAQSGVHLVLRQGETCVVYDVPPRDVAKFEKGLNQVQSFFDGQAGGGQTTDAARAVDMALSRDRSPDFAAPDCDVKT